MPINFEPSPTGISSIYTSVCPLHQHYGHTDDDHEQTIKRLSDELRHNLPDHYNRACGVFSGIQQHGLTPIIHNIDTNNGDISYSIVIGHIHLNGFILVADTGEYLSN